MRQAVYPNGQWLCSRLVVFSSVQPLPYCECAPCLRGQLLLEPFLPAPGETQHQWPSSPLHFSIAANDTLDLSLELLHLWSISSPYPNSCQIPLIFQSLLPYPHLTIYSLFVYSTNIYRLTTSLSPLIPLLFSSIPISRALQTFIPFPTSSDPMCFTSSAPWTFSCQHPKFSCFGPWG